MEESPKKRQIRRLLRSSPQIGLALERQDCRISGCLKRRTGMLALQIEGGLVLTKTAGVSPLDGSGLFFLLRRYDPLL